MIYHITTSEEWKACQRLQAYAPAAYATEGFVHASKKDQLAAVLKRYYANRSDLLLLVIDEGKLTCQLVFEPSTNDELYPHIYGEINKDAIAHVVHNFSMSDIEGLEGD